MSTLTELILSSCEGGVAAARARTPLMPVGGPGEKILPPTYEGGHYAWEKRLLDGEGVVETVLLDSVQSQANRFEEALLEAYRSGDISVPVFELEIPGHGTLTSLEVPHRVNDAILRDSLWCGKPFRESDQGQRIVQARPWKATAMFEFAPTALLLGTWDSQAGAGVGSAKFARALVSEIVGFGAVEGVRTSSRIDPLGIKAIKGLICRSETEMWNLNETYGDKKAQVKLLKSGRPSEINHGNVTPTITARKVEKGREKIEPHGGVTIREAVQTTVLSFAQLRRLRFPEEDGRNSAERDIAGRAVLAALGLYAFALQQQDGFQLRSRCQLVPVRKAHLEFIGVTVSDIREAEIDPAATREALEACRERARAAGLDWKPGPIKLTPAEKLLKLVRISDESVEVEEE